MKILFKDLKPGDKFRTEFGDYDNWVTVIADKVNIVDENRCVVYCHYLNGISEEMWGCPQDRVELLEEGIKE